ncbi:MAG: 4-hydroxy-3-methylbut-2-enyl diphosphate reductase [Bacteroidales bacterium]|nr:4-hydroxy-3-methylbut-2-enyl diphosphate reductase [Bacteroidales bacterium]MCF8456124.1 4-hydroxy-3-methylbut-2-enyl diphosphate reductase [Bacteroidales bacterium]
MKVEIEGSSGFCFGVRNAVDKAEDILRSGEKLYCLGDIVHNGQEIARLEALGLITIDSQQFRNLKNCKVLLRAHGEPPSTYQYARENNIELIDATCPIVLNLQKKIKKSYQEPTSDKQVVIFGKSTHPEVISLVGQTENKAIVVENISDLTVIDFSKSISLYAQTTMDTRKFKGLADELHLRNINQKGIKVTQSICGAVSGRESKLIEFAKKKDVLIFVGGKKSSNGKMLFGICLAANKHSYYISSAEELNPAWISNSEQVGVCGATSTPIWLLERVAKQIQQIG